MQLKKEAHKMSNINVNPIAANMIEVSINGLGVILFSYSTPVAAATPEGLFKTSEKWSDTTSRHINAWLDGRTATEKPQGFFDNLGGL